MCSIDMWFSDSSSSDSDEKYDARVIRLQRKYIRDRTNPLEMSCTEFISNFRLSKNAFLDVLTEIDDKEGLRSSSIPNMLKLAITLKFLAKGMYQTGIEKEGTFGLAQATISYVIKDVLHVLEQSICRQYIDFQYSEEETEEIESHFKEKTGIPGVLGCIDSFHVKIIAPEKKLQHLYLNSKCYYSIKTMIVCDHKMVIRYINAKHPGSSDDAMIFDVSTLKTYLENRYQKGHRSSWLLGDANFDLEPYLMTPYWSTKIDSPQSYYNQCHTKARRVIANTICILKARFKCLNGKKSLHYIPKKASQIINVCAALHNICCAFNLPPPLNEEESPLEESDDGEHEDEDQDAELDYIQDNADAVQIRNEIAKTLFEATKVDKHLHSSSKK